MKRIEIKKSNKKIAFLLFASITFSILGALIMFHPEKFITLIFKNEMAILISGIMGFLFFGTAFLFILKKNIMSKIGLIVDENGITDNSSGVSLGLIEWKDVKSIRKDNVLSTHFLLIDVYNPNKYLLKAKNKFILSLLKSNQRMYRTPISISSTALKCDFQELHNIINEHHKLYLAKDLRTKL